MRIQCSNCQAINAIEPGERGIDFACGRCEQTITAPETSLARGVVLGDFVLIEAVVKRTHETDFLAQQISLERPAVVKVMNPELSAKSEFIQEFLAAARQLSRLCHPNICPLYAIGREDDVFYLARESGPATSLKHNLLTRGVMTWQEAVPVMIDVARALDFAWETQQTMHYNLKPDYIMVGYAAGSKLCDVGLAGVDPEGDSERIIGTPQYLAPERIVGMDGDNRSDLYSLGVSFFFTITGEFPFVGESTNEIVSKHLEEFPRPANQVVSDIPTHVCSIIDMLLEKNPHDRYQTGNMLIEDLEAVARGQVPAHAMKGARISPSQDQYAAINSPMRPGTLRVHVGPDQTGTALQANAESERSTVIKVTKGDVVHADSPPAKAGIPTDAKAPLNRATAEPAAEAPPAFAAPGEPPPAPAAPAPVPAAESAEDASPTIPTAPADGTARIPITPEIPESMAPPSAEAAPAPPAPAEAAPAEPTPAPPAPAEAAPAEAAPAPPAPVEATPAEAAPAEATPAAPAPAEAAPAPPGQPAAPTSSGTHHDPKEPLPAIVGDDDDDDDDVAPDPPPAAEPGTPPAEPKKKKKKKRKTMFGANKGKPLHTRTKKKRKPADGE